MWLAAFVPACAGEAGGGEVPSSAPPRAPDLGVYSGDGGARLDAAGTGCAAGEEICDGLDNNCDGRVDEIGCPCVGPRVCYGGPPATRGVGECRDGERGCDSTGEYFTGCSGWVGPAPEGCDGRDDDCDGQVDDGCCETPPCEGAGGGGGGGGSGVGGGGGAGAGGAGGGSPEADAGSPGAPREDRFVVGQDEVVRPADFIMAVDNSASMKDTVAEVEANLGAFATRLVGAAVDYRFVLVSEKGATRRDPDVCIPPPMAGPDCADTDRFHHLDERVDSHSAFSDIVQCFNACEHFPGGYGDFLRPDSLLQVIVVTDDESVVSWDEFRDGMADLGRPDLILHGVVGLDAEGCAARVGHEYVFGARATGGEVLDICDQDWGRVLEVVFNQTVLRLQFTFALTAPPRADSLRVFVVVGEVPEEEQHGNWRYEPARNYVVFDPDGSPPLGAVVIARYISP